jgi:2'-5' RNA ligase
VDSLHDPGAGRVRSLRLFAALDPDPAVRDALARAVARLRRLGGPVSWTRPEQAHLTLVFAGDTPPSFLDAGFQALDEAAARTPPLDLRVRGLGAFGRPGRPAVLWAGIEDPPPALAALQARLAAGLLPPGARPERRPVRPHITLGRVRAGPVPRALLDALRNEAAGEDFGTFRADRVLWMRSDPSERGVRHTRLHEARLTGPPDTPPRPS